MSNRPTVWLEASLQPGPLARMHEVADVITGNEDALAQQCDIVVLGALRRINDAWLTAAGPRLKVVARVGIGTDNVDIDACTKHNVMVINTPDAPSESTAEHAVALMMALAAGVVGGDRNVRGEPVSKASLKGIELKGKTLGIIGLGRIGRRVAEMACLGIRMRVIGFDPYTDQTTIPYVEFVDSIDTLLARSDVVSLNAAMTDKTRGMFTEATLRKFKKGALFINCARGLAVDEAALYRVLKDGHLGGAALDVFEPEPPPLDHPLLTLSNLIATPHIASFTDVGTNSMGNGVVDQVIQLNKGEKPMYLINASVWPGRGGRI